MNLRVKFSMYRYRILQLMGKTLTPYQENMLAEHRADYVQTANDHNAQFPNEKPLVPRQGLL